MTISVDNAPIYTVIPTLEIPEVFVIRYWETLDRSSLIQHRWCDVVNPTPQDILSLIYHTPLGRSMFNVVVASELVAEFSLTNFTGKAAMVHFSMHPENTPQQSMHYARAVTDDVLNIWREQGNPDAPYLCSLYGLTPVTNRAACAFVQRVGFRKIGVLPMGQRVNGSEFVDAMITIKESKHGWKGIGRGSASAAEATAGPAE